MDKQYQPIHIEQHILNQWDQAHVGKPSDLSEPTYCILFPPPNVTGSLHMGHGFLITLSDILIRYHRMCGDNTLWQMGTDHAGIATQMVVEKNLLAQGIERQNIGREAFVNHIHDWVKNVDIHDQIERMGASVDWDSKLYTQDDNHSDIVLRTFVKLYESGHIYRGEKLVNWDTTLQTAISDLEIENKEIQGQLYEIQYHIENSDDTIIIATTRPETMLADSAIAVHPEDERYQSLIGKNALIPLTHRTIPIIADEYVDPAFGTGCLKITPAHDFNDNEVGLRHQLDHFSMLNLDGTLNEHTPESLQGLTVKEARKRIIAMLKEANQLIDIKPHRHMVPHAERSGAVVEPLYTKQWFMCMDELAPKAIDVVRNGEVELIPGHWQKTYEHFLNNITDWCISRQLWWGHQIPAWYDEQGNVYVGMDEQQVREQHGLDASITLQQDHDVLDTWFSSSLYPLSTLGFVDNPERFKQYFPTNVLITGFDILFFWVARMIMMSLHLTGEVPFKQVFLHGLVRDEQGNKMSKSKGNVINPMDLVDGISLEMLIEKRTYGMMQPKLAESIAETTKKHFPDGIDAYGTDALRMCYAAACTQGRDIRIPQDQLKGYKFFCNKLWNACRFLLMQTAESITEAGPMQPQFILDQWIHHEFHNHLSKATEHLNSYRFDLFAKTWYDFIWHYYCDWYLEMLKASANHNPDANDTYQFAVYLMGQILHVIHPIMPFITEALWQEISPKLGQDHHLLALSTYPKPLETAPVDTIVWAKNLITAIRTLRSEGNISPDQVIHVELENGTELDRHQLSHAKHWVIQLCKLASIDWVEKADPLASSTIIETLNINIPLRGIIDPDRELMRLTKVIEKLEKESIKLDKQLGNSKFIAQAPEALVTEVQAQKQQNTAKHQFLNKQLQIIKQIKAEQP